jgi:PIN domain nuclease of toxin-antitoxin system
VKTLLDTHAVLWFMLDDSRLSRPALSLISDSQNECFVSPASHWEIAIKISIGKYRLNDNFEDLWLDVLNQFTMLAIEPRHTAQLLSLPFHHKDPFDRLIIAQALAEGMSIVSGDAVLDLYGVQRLW